MTKKELQEFKDKLLMIKNTILNSGIIQSTEDLTVSTDDLPDEADLANNVINQQVTFNMRNRELQKLKNIDMALMRIDDGIYGVCEDCDDPISKKRLQNQPWAEMCITHAEEKEREQVHYKSRLVG